MKGSDEKYRVFGAQNHSLPGVARAKMGAAAILKKNIQTGQSCAVDGLAGVEQRALQTLPRWLDRSRGEPRPSWGLFLAPIREWVVIHGRAD